MILFPVMPENVLTIVKIDSQGNYPWGIQGVTIPRQGYRDNTLQFVSDGSGGAIASWEEMEIPAVTTPGVASQNTYRLLAQRIDSQGKLPWGDNVLLYVAPNGTRFEGPRTVNDGRGGIIVSWLQVTEVPADSSGLRSQKMDIGLQKVDSNGQVLWQPDGVQLGATGTVTDSSVLIGDDSGGAILIWRDRRQATANAMHIYAQRVNADGNAAWQAGGVDVSATSLNPGSQAASDGSGGAIISYAFQEDGQKLHIQKLDNRGLTAWTPNGISVTECRFFQPDHFSRWSRRSHSRLGRREGLIQFRKSLHSAGRHQWQTDVGRKRNQAKPLNNWSTCLIRRLEITSGEPVAIPILRSVKDQKWKINRFQ